MALRCDRILVTGGSQGVGLAIAKRLCEEGASVTITAKHQENLDAALKVLPEGRAFGVLLDVENTGAFSDVVEKAAAKMGGIDCLINQAGSSPNPFMETGFGVLDISEEDWDLTINQNLRGAFFLSKAFVWHLLNHNQVFGGNEIRHLGDIINVSVDASMLSGTYSVAAGGVNAMTASWAKWLDKYGIVVNGVGRRLRETSASGSSYHAQELNTEGYIDPDEEVADIVAFLLQERSINIQGQTILCNGRYRY